MSELPSNAWQCRCGSYNVNTTRCGSCGKGKTAIEIESMSQSEDRESKLHQQIMDWCDAQWPKWQYFHGSMAHRAMRTPGEPDFIIMAPEGRTLYIECKSKGGKLSQDQLDVQKKAEMLGNSVLVIRSFDEFIQLTERVETKCNRCGALLLVTCPNCCDDALENGR